MDDSGRAAEPGNSLDSYCCQLLFRALASVMAVLMVTKDRAQTQSLALSKK